MLLEIQVMHAITATILSCESLQLERIKQKKKKKTRKERKTTIRYLFRMQDCVG